MKILLATPLYPPEIGGPATYTKEIATVLRKKHDVTVLAYTAKNPEPIEGVQLFFVDKLKILPYRLFVFFMTAYTLAKEVDVIYVQNAVAAGLPAVLAGILRKKPVVLKFVGDESWERAVLAGKTKKLLVDFLHNPDGGLQSFILRHIQKFVLQHVTVLTTPSKYLGEEIKKAYKLHTRFVVNYNTASVKDETLFPVEKKPHSLVTTARLTSWKHIDGIITAVSLLKSKFPDIHLTVAGDGPEMDRLQQLTKKLELENHVTFTGRISRSETYHLRKESEIYVLNSTYEGLPHTVLSSFAAKIPVVATSIPGTTEAVYDMKTGLLVKPNNPQDLAEKITQLLENPALQKELVANAYALLQDKFSLQNHVKVLESILKSVISKPGNKTSNSFLK